MESENIKENAEFSGNKDQDEDLLLVAQRYLNIFHQIHIFNNRKKKEFNDSLLALPPKIKQVLVQIPGGRILLEHILELEEHAGKDTEETKFLILKKDPNNRFANRDNQSLPSQSSDVKLSDNFASTLAKSFAMALKENNLLFSTFGTHIPIASAGKQTNGKQLDTKNSMDYSLANILSQALKDSNKQYHEDFIHALETISSKLAPTTIKSDDVPVSVITDSISQVLKDTGKQQLEAMKTFGASIASSIVEAQNKAISNIKQAKTINTISTLSKTSNPLSGESERVSLSNSQIKTQTPKSENKTASLRQSETKPRSSQTSKSPKYSAPQSQYYSSANTYADDDEWEYVDENGNPVDGYDEEWEYVDENGNPVDGYDDEWEYVDENGNPVNPSDMWEYVEEEAYVTPEAKPTPAATSVKTQSKPETKQESSSLSFSTIFSSSAKKEKDTTEKNKPEKNPPEPEPVKLKDVKTSAGTQTKENFEDVNVVDLPILDDDDVLDAGLKTADKKSDKPAPVNESKKAISADSEKNTASADSKKNAVSTDSKKNAVSTDSEKKIELKAPDKKNKNTSKDAEDDELKRLIREFSGG